MSSYPPTSPRELPPHRACTLDSTCVRNVENQLISGLGILIDYLNKGNGEPQLSRLRRRAELWCQTYFGSLDYTIAHRGAVVPQSVLDVHPHLFDVRIESHSRLDPPPPPPPPAASAESSSSSSSSRSTPSLVSDNDTEMESDSDANSQSPASIEKDADTGGTKQKRRRRRGDHFCHQFPQYTEPVLLPDKAIDALLDRYDRDTALHEACRRKRLLAALYEGAGVGASMPPEHRSLLFDRSVRAADLRGSPLLHHMPELLAYLAGLPPAPAYTQFLRNKQRRVDEHDVAQKIYQESLPYGPMTQPCPLPGLAGSVRMPRLGVAEMARRAKAAEEKTEDKDVFMCWSTDCAKEEHFNQNPPSCKRRHSSSDTDDSDSDDSDSDSDDADSLPRAPKRLVIGMRCW
ncbi:hypothetical protein MY8738_000796 [Beauveria namnaoensis]